MRGVCKGDWGSFHAPSPCCGPLTPPSVRPLGAPSRSLRVPGGGMLSPLSYGVPSTPHPRAKRGMRGGAREVRPPHFTPLPPLTRTGPGCGAPLRAPPPFMQGRGCNGRRHNPLPLLSRSRARAKRPHSHLYPHPVCSRRGRRDGPSRGRCGEGPRALPPPRFACAQGKGTTGRGRGEGGAPQCGACGP